MKNTTTKKALKVKYWYGQMDSEFWGVTAGRKAEETKIYFRNGEHHLVGKWTDTGEKIDELPFSSAKTR